MVQMDEQNLLDRLRQVIRSHGRMLIAYSGGVDSGLLVYVAREVLGDDAIPVLGLSDSIGAHERQEAIAFLVDNGIPYATVETREMEDPRYRRNHADRCFFCKNELFERLGALAREHNAEAIAYGANTDDRGDYRPGARAAEAHGVVAPLAESGLGKEAIRRIARRLGLSLWDKPAAPCLASRIPYFREVTPRRLAQIDAAEGVLRDHGFRECRVRHYDGVARVEVPVADHERIRPLWDRIRRGILAAGFASVVLETEGLRSGRLNDALLTDRGSTR
jgi:uncharacterized protein